MVIYFCFSAYNEECNLPALLKSLEHCAQLLPDAVHVVAYNDGSTDQTDEILAQAASALSPIVLGGLPNRGLGFGLAVLVRYVAEASGNGDVAIFLDADNSHDPRLAPSFLESIDTGADVVIASRVQPESRIEGFPPHRWALTRAAAWYFGAMLGVPGVSDYTSGFRAYRTSALKRLVQAGGTNGLPNGFECQVELLLRLSQFSTFSEVPFTYHYGAKRGASKMRVGRTILRNLMVGVKGFRQRPHEQ